MFVAGNSVCEIDLTRQPAIGEQFHRPIHRRITDSRVLFADNVIDVFDAPVSFVLDEVLQNQFAMRSEFELLLFEVIEENMHLWRGGFHGGAVEAGMSFNASLE